MSAWASSVFATPWRLVAVVVTVALVVAYAVGSGRWVTTGSAWYLDLRQPPWQPPPPVFGVAWAYNFLAIASVGILLSWRAPATRVTVFLAVLAVSIGLAIAWAYLFYGAHSLTAAAVALTGCALLTVVPVTVAFLEQPWLGAVLIPYQVWLVIATSLSWGYVVLND